MPDATEWLVEYADALGKPAYERALTFDDALNFIGVLVSQGRTAALYERVPYTITVHAPRKRRKTPPPAPDPDPAPPLAGPGNGAAGEPKDCEARFDVDPVCPCPAEFDPVTRGWFCSLHLNAIGLAGRLELHRKHASRNRPVRVAHA